MYIERVHLFVVRKIWCFIIIQRTCLSIKLRVVRERKSPQKSRSTKQIQRKDVSRSEFTRKKKYKCYNCGGSERHKLQDCPAYSRECKTCGKRNHFASVSLSKRSDDVKAVTSELDYDSDSHDDEYAFSIEEVGMIKEKGKQLIATLSFADENSNFSTEIILNLILEPHATWLLIDLSIINQDANPKLQQSNVKLRLFDASVLRLSWIP